ncbi:MAG: hypothetical protein ACPG6K_08555, partial [Pseudohongiellaceae bacterium]
GRAMQWRGLMALLLMILSAAQGPVTAQTQIANADWEGEWLAEGTLFRIGVTSDNGLLKITQIESMGQIWSSGDGKIDGNIARVEVEYAGAAGVIRAELLDAKTAVLSAASCQPEFMVVCALSQGRQAIFRKVAGQAASDSNN